MGAKVIQKIMLDAGCGDMCNHGFVGMDKRELKDVQIVHDMEDLPWPLDDKSCSVVKMSHVIEHIKPWMQIDVMNECWRVLDDDGILLISTPYGMSYRYNQDPTHCSPWVEATIEYFIQGTPLYEVYKPKPWKEERKYWDLRGDIEVALRKLEEEVT